MTSAPQAPRGTRNTRSTLTRMPAISAMCSPLIAKMCIVPVRMKGSETSLVSAVGQPSAMAQISRSDSSSTGRPRASVIFAQAENRSTHGGDAGRSGWPASCQSFVPLVCS